MKQIKIVILTLHFPRNMLLVLLERKQTNAAVCLGKDRGRHRVSCTDKQRRIALWELCHVCSGYIVERTIKAQHRYWSYWDPPICSRSTITLTLLSGIPYNFSLYGNEEERGLFVSGQINNGLLVLQYAQPVTFYFYYSNLTLRYFFKYSKFRIILTPKLLCELWTT